MFGRRHPDWLIKQIASKQKGRPGYWLGKKRSKETIEKISKAIAGRKMSQDFCLNISQRMKGKPSPLKGKTKETTIWLKERSELYKNRLPWNTGLTKETDERIKQQAKNFEGHPCYLLPGVYKMPEERKEQIRKFNKERLKTMKAQDCLLSPNIGNSEEPITQILESCFGHTIKRPCKVLNYFVDGYCPALHLFIEIDEPYHKYGKQKEHDERRQKEIEEYTGCRFLRIDVPQNSGTPNKFIFPKKELLYEFIKPKENAQTP